MSKLKDMTGMRFGRLVISHRDKNRTRAARWLCICDCGKEKSIEGHSLRAGLSRSCGCLNSEITAKRNWRHGMAHVVSEYNIWASMIQRCLNPRSHFFHHYGGRGISICKRWLSFRLFFKDMWPRPNLDQTLDRIDNDSGYSPRNCRWANRKIQARNRRGNVHVSIGGKTLTISELAEISGLNYGTVWHRLKSGWKADKAAATPVRGGR